MGSVEILHQVKVCQPQTPHWTLQRATLRLPTLPDSNSIQASVTPCQLRNLLSDLLWSQRGKIRSWLCCFLCSVMAVRCVNLSEPISSFINEVNDGTFL